MQIRLLVGVSACLLLSSGTSQSEAVFCPLYNFGVQGAGDPLWPLPPSRLAAPADGLLYGTSNSGGTGLSQGTLFRMTSSGDLTLIWKFDGHDTGAGPQGGLS